MDQFSFFIGISLNIWLIFFHLGVAFPTNGGDIEADFFQIIGLLFVVGSYILGLLGMLPMFVSALFAFVVTFLHSSKQRKNTLEWLQRVV